MTQEDMRGCESAKVAAREVLDRKTVRVYYVFMSKQYVLWSCLHEVVIYVEAHTTMRHLYFSLRVLPQLVMQSPQTQTSTCSYLLSFGSISSGSE